jgi:flagellar hook-associated protein 3 FlgL
MTDFYPAIAGRTSTQLSTSRLLFQIHHDQSAIQTLQTQLSTGRRIVNPSDDPSAAIRALSAQRQLEYKQQVDDNLQSADVILSASESTLAQAHSILNEMRGVAVLASGNTLSDDELDALGSQVQAAIQKLAELGNSKFRDQYIFSGNNVTESPFEYAEDSVRFKGNAFELQTISDYSSTLSANVTANDAFGAKSAKVIGSVDLNPAIAADTPLANLNRGEGIRRGAISLSNGLEVVEVDLSSAHNISDVIEQIEATSIGTRNFQVTLTANGLTVGFSDGLGGLLRIQEVGSGNAAADLGINNSLATPAAPVLGSDLNPVLTNTTKLSQLLNGAGIALGESFQIQQGDKTYAISTNGLDTVEDLLNRIQLSGAQVQASIDKNGRSISIQSIESGTALSIGEAGGNLAQQLGIRTFSLDTQVKDLNFGQGIFAAESGPDLIFTRSDGTPMSVSLTGVQTVGNVISRINNHVDNFSPTTRIVASLSTTGNGIVLTAPTGAAPISVQNAGGSQAAWGLGLIARDQQITTGTNSGSSNVIQGTDVSGIEVEGTFTSLIRMRQAIEVGRPEDLIRITAALDADLQRMSLARSFIGTRQQSIGNIIDLSAEQQLQLKQIESDELDADLASVISELSSREAALQASLQLMGQTTRQTLFDYI